MKRTQVAQLAVCSVAIALILGALLMWRDSLLSKRIEALRAAGHPVSLTDLKPQSITPGNNAAYHIEQITSECGELYNALAPLFQSGFSWRTGLEPELLESATAAFDAQPEVLDALFRAADCEHYASNNDYATRPSAFTASSIKAMEGIRTAARVLDCRARYLASIGDGDEAAQVYLKQLRLAELYSREALLSSFLTNLAIQGVAIEGLSGVLQTSQFAPKTHTAIEAELAKQAAIPGFVHALVRERAFGIDSFQGMWIGQSHCLDYLDYMQLQIDLGAQSQFEMPPVVASPQQPLTVNVASAVDAARQAMNRTRAAMRCLRVANAIIASDLSSEAISLEKLGLPADVTIDPFNGKPLKFKSTPDGWLVYSVGKDEQDGGGDIKDNQVDVGVGPPELLR